MEPLVVILAIVLIVGIVLTAWLWIRAARRPRRDPIDEGAAIARALHAMLNPVAAAGAAALAAPVKRRLELAPHLVRVCGRCVHFDLEEGQAVIRNNPAFAEAARWVTPRRMGTRLLSEEYVDEEGRPQTRLLPPEQQPDPNIPERCAWEDFGACMKHHEVLWAEQNVDEVKLEGHATPGCSDFKRGVEA